MNKAFFKAFRIKRDKALKVKQKVYHKGKPKINFVTDYDPGFPYINRILSEHKHILEDYDQCRTLFPKNCFRVTHRRGHRNLRKWLAPSNARLQEVTSINHDEPNPGCIRCEKCVKDPQWKKSQWYL